MRMAMPNGGQYWRYNYRFRGKHKTLALGTHPDVSLDKARARHEVARTLLADGIGPATRKRSLRKHASRHRPVKNNGHLTEVIARDYQRPIDA